MQKTTQVYDLTPDEQGQGGLGASEVIVAQNTSMFSGQQTTLSYSLKISDDENLPDTLKQARKLGHLQNGDTVTFAFTFDNAGKIFCKNMYINKDQPDNALIVEKQMQLPFIGRVTTYPVLNDAKQADYGKILDAEYERFQKATINGKPYSHYIAVSQQGVQALGVEQGKITPVSNMSYG